MVTIFPLQYEAKALADSGDEEGRSQVKAERRKGELKQLFQNLEGKKKKAKLGSANMLEK